MSDKDVKDRLDKLFSEARSFDVERETGDVEKYFIVTPGADEIRKSDWEYSKAYSMALKEGVFTSEEMLDILRRRNIIGDDYDRRAETLRTGLQAALVEMELSDSADEKRAQAEKVQVLREELWRWNSRLQGPLAHTCEQLASNSKTEFLTAVVVFNSGGERVWETFEDYINEKDALLSFRARLEVMLWLEGVDSDFIDNSPEKVLLRELDAEELAVAEAEEVVEEPILKEDAVKEVSSTQEIPAAKEVPKQRKKRIPRKKK
jgi:hypothetical protein